MFLLLKNYVLNAAVFSWLAAQTLKTIFNIINNKTFDPERLIGSGGMPSAHSAAVCALTMAVSRKLGFASPEFAISFILATVVMYDAMGIRRAAGEQAKVLNKIVNNYVRKVVNDEISHNDDEQSKEEIALLEDVEELDELDESEADEMKVNLKELLGHTPLEVLCGALLGILISLLLPVI